MKASIPQPRAVGGQRRGRRDAFALIVTLLILSLLVVVAVSYLSSMVGERQTADAYSSKARAEQIAQAGVDSAMAILTESFRDFPDSATVWDTQQSQNTGTPYSTAIVNTPTNEGTSLYLRAVPTTATLPATASGGTATTATVADPRVSNTPTAANDSTGNNPNNPACKNFVLPLISGVPGGRARLVSEKLPPAPNKAGMIPSMDLTKADPGLQNYTDLNVRRFAGDLQGVIGSPPDWATTGGTAPVGPKPARALWVNLQDAAGRTTGRYAFWMEDESFRANSNFLGDSTQPPDNVAQPLDSNNKRRSLQPDDLTLLGLLTLANDDTPANDATSILNTRKAYPGSFFPDSLALIHSVNDGKSAFSQTKSDWLHYLTTTQSGALNLTRHGTQRLNLNAIVDPNAAPNSTTLNQVTKIVQTLKFHLPNFGQRFYRTSVGTSPSVLNNAQQVPGSPKSDANVVGDNHSEIYYWKVAANIEDYVDSDTQPTIIMAHGTLGSLPAVVESLNADQANQSSEIWAQGKEAAPYIQEAAVRWRPIVHDHAAGAVKPYAYDLYMDYYVEVWNMTNRDIYATPQSDPSLPNLHNARLHISHQQTWDTYPNHSVLVCDGPNPYQLGNMGPDADLDIDLSTGVSQNINGSVQSVNGVVFKAGACTIITTDPDFMSYVFKGPPGAASTSKMPAANTTPTVNLGTTFYCQNLGGTGKRHYTGHVTPVTQNGIYSRFRDNPRGGVNLEDDDVHMALYNSYGYLDSVTCAISEHGGPQWINTDNYASQAGGGTYNDFSYSSCLFGNIADSQLFFPSAPSQLGDPRTNNEQLSITQSYVVGGTGDQSRFIYGSGADTTLGYPNGLSQKPEQNYAWPDYYSLPATSGTTLYPQPDASNAPMVVADAALTSIGQLGDIFDPARVPNPLLTNGILYSRGGGRTFKLGQHDERYTSDPSGSTGSNNTLDDIPASNGWASWRLADVFDVANPIETPACININGVQRDKGAALLSLLQGFKFQPQTSTGLTTGTTDPVVHGDGHSVTGSSPLAGQALNTTTAATEGFAQLIKQMTTRLNNATPSSGPAGPFFERGELGELGTGNSVLFGSNPVSTFTPANKLLVGTVDTNKTFDHGREEIFRRIAQMICTRGDTFTVYAVGQSVVQPTTAATIKVTGTHRMLLTFRLVPKKANGDRFNPGYTINSSTGNLTPKTDYASFGDTTPDSRFARPDHYDVQILQTSTF